ncbi:acetyl esterase/lipase [Amycolatopsis bartoniae]|uniref:Acetylesterase n=1 Tax=Amycolatopsis bartoniae TaxID=941986 RepID=A0A8H9M372_9PSEU|nr:alpha/beta hydrolase [Amycolatopsis bartoniae]MBB2939708.1 acetyl esterase/lipase [Amycolatopsis bartoniae]TVT06173.1 alpha/beta hydrolase [Amycolatopsis bartoniae]GHF36355.1 acetylesterase [Amycolatopsis bartoniae]
MPSPEALAVIEQFRTQPPADTAGLSYQEQREQSGQMISSMAPLPADAKTESVTVAGVPALWVEVPESEPDRAVLYLHGGGYVVGSVLSHRELAARIARAAKARVVVLDYRMAPEAPHPAAVDDAVGAYRFLLDEGFVPARITIAGDSAGGGLTVATLVALRDRGVPLPAAGVALSPWTDLTLSGKTITSKVDEEPILDVDTLRLWAGLYTGDHDPADPLISPLNADLSGLPPLLVQVGTAEVLLSDAERLVDKVKAAGGVVEYQPEPGLFHCYQLFPLYPEAQQGVDRIGQFVLRHTAE